MPSIVRLLATAVLASFSAVSLAAPAPLTAPASSPAPALAPAAPENAPLLLAAKKKKKKKKKKSEEAEEFGPADIEAVADNDTGVGIHREQEGVDAPYQAEVTGVTSLSFLTVQTGDGDPSDATEIDLDGFVLFRLGSLGIGPEIGYQMATTSTTTTSTGLDDQKVTTTTETKSSALKAGGLLKFYFGDLDHGLNVPFAYGGLAYRMAESKADGADAVKATGFVIKAGGGLNMFLDSNVAFAPQAEYRMQTEKGDADGAEETKISGFRILFALATFL